MFGSLFNRGRRSSDDGPARGTDEHYALDAAFIDIVTGADRRLTLPDGHTLNVKIPPGLTSGQVLRLRGQGEPGRNGGPNGDALLEISVAPHVYFTREAQNIRLELPVSLGEAVLGGMVDVPTPSGPVRMRIPAGSDSGTVLRLRGRGVAKTANHEAGDLYARLRVEVGPSDPALEAFLRAWQPEHARDPRQPIRDSS